MKLSTIVRLAENRKPDKDPQVEALRRQIEDLTKTADQLKRRMEALTGPAVNKQTAEALRTSIQRRIDAVNEDKQEVQTQIQEISQDKAEQCNCPGEDKPK